MSSRVLQENGSLLLTEGGEAIINDNFISTQGFVSGVPTVANTVVNQSHLLSPVGIASREPYVTGADIVETNILFTSNLVTGLPVVVSSGFGQTHIILCGSVEVQNPVLSSPYYDAALSRTASITADSSNSVSIEDVNNNSVSITELSNVIILSSSVNQQTKPILAT